MILRHPELTRRDTLFPYAPLFRCWAGGQDVIAAGGQDRATVQGTHQAFIDGRALEPERVDVLHDRQPGGRHPVSDRSGMAMRGFRPQKVGQYLHRGALALKAGGDRIVERARHALEPKPAHRLRSEEHTSELQSLMRISYAVF